jgi:hypothetical protein
MSRGADSSAGESGRVHECRGRAALVVAGGGVKEEAGSAGRADGGGGAPLARRSARITGLHLAIVVVVRETADCAGG